MPTPSTTHRPIKLACKCGARFYRAQALLWDGMLYCPVCSRQVKG